MPQDDHTLRGDPPRRYSDREVGRLLKCATELQQAEESGGPGGQGGDGMTLATLQEVAAEAGIEPRYVQLAAARIDSPEPTGLRDSLAGTPLLLRAERILPGELREEDYEQIVAEIQMATDVPGNPSMVGRTLTWRSVTSEHQFRSLQVTVASRNGETRIQAEERLHGYAGALYGGGVGGAGMGVGFGVGFGVGLGALGSPLFAAAFPVTLIGGLYVAMRQIMKSIGRKRRAKLDELVDRIARYAEPPSQ